MSPTTHCLLVAWCEAPTSLAQDAADHKISPCRAETCIRQPCCSEAAEFVRTRNLPTKDFFYFFPPKMPVGCFASLLGLSLNWIILNRENTSHQNCFLFHLAALQWLSDLRALLSCFLTASQKLIRTMCSPKENTRCSEMRLCNIPQCKNNAIVNKSLLCKFCIRAVTNSCTCRQRSNSNTVL